MKLRLPDELIVSLALNKVDVLELIFQEMLTEGNNDNEALEKATSCVTQLIIVSQKNKVKYQTLTDFIVSKIEILSGKVQSIIQSQNKELAEMYQEIFIEIGRSNINSIIDGNN